MKRFRLKSAVLGLSLAAVICATLAGCIVYESDTYPSYYSRERYYSRPYYYRGYSDPYYYRRYGRSSHWNDND